MSTKNQFDWVDFYNEFALKLLEFKDKRHDLVEKVKEIYSISGVNMPTLEKDNNLIDIDPFTVFGLFNKKLKDDNRIKILTAIAELFDVKTSVPLSFDSLPVLNPQNATFYYFIDGRSDNDIDDLWELFSSALDYAAEQTDDNKKVFSHYFDLVINKKGNGNSKVTMGLYWISPDFFLNLDSRNEWFIYKSGKIPSDVVKQLPVVDTKISSSKYLLIIESINAYLQSSRSEFKNFKELSFEAWKYSEQINQEIAAEKRAELKANSTLADNVDTVHYWIYAPGEGSTLWEEFYNSGIMAIAWGDIGDLRDFESKEDMQLKMKEVFDNKLTYKNSAHATWQFANEMKVGDVIFVKKGMHKIIGRGIVTSDYEFDAERSDDYKNFRKVNWTNKGEWPHPGQAAMKTLTDITSYTDYVEKLNALFEDDSKEDVEDLEKTYPEYTREDFLSEVYMSEEDYDRLTRITHDKKNVILQGAPGVGKTFVAKRLAFSMMGVKDVERVMMVQFHQSYSYEDFIMGFRPSTDGFELKKGAFYNFCKKAEVDIDKDYFFIIDEINRGNLSKIFGELFMLIENDKRGVSLQLLYSDEKFYVPKNVHIIGMMNTADRSLAMLDYALRRRFAFFELKPGFATPGFENYMNNLGSKKFDKLISCIVELNKEISTDDLLGEGFCIGHSYFCNLSPDAIDDQALLNIVEFELIPLLKEYWFDEPDNIIHWSGEIRGAIK